MKYHVKDSRGVTLATCYDHIEARHAFRDLNLADDSRPAWLIVDDNGREYGRRDHAPMVVVERKLHIVKVMRRVGT